MKRHERTATDGNRRWRTGHQVMISAAVIWIFVADRTDDRHFIGHLGQLRNGLTKPDSGNSRGDWAEVTADFFRRIGLGIECLVMRWPAIEPDHDAIDLLG